MAAKRYRRGVEETEISEEEFGWEEIPEGGEGGRSVCIGVHPNMLIYMYIYTYIYIYVYYIYIYRRRRRVWLRRDIGGVRGGGTGGG